MRVLGVESSCDELGLAVVEDATKVVAEIVASQANLHAKYGGVVPEVASRRHLEVLVPTVRELRKMVDISKVEAVAVSFGPGLVGPLLVGISCAKAIAMFFEVPIIAVNHLEAHIFSVFLGNEAPPFPFLALLVSGGHTQIVWVEDVRKYRVLGETRDDAAGEAFDKVAKAMGLGYPGGPKIEKLAKVAKSAEKIAVPKVSGLDFSFSGIKTSAIRALRKGAPKEAVAKGFQDAVVEHLLSKLDAAVLETNAKRVALVGGVAANSLLRERLGKLSERRNFKVFMAPLKYCMDNGAMVASAGCLLLERGILSSLDFDAVPYAEL